MFVISPFLYKCTSSPNLTEIINFKVPSGAICSVSYLFIFNYFCQTNYPNTYWSIFAKFLRLVELWL